MATTTTVTLTREHRNAIYAAAESVMSGATDLRLYFERAESDPENRDWIRRMAGNLAVCVRLLDQLGWRRHGDRETYRLKLDQDILDFMEDLERESRATLESDRRTLLQHPYSRHEFDDDEQWESERAVVRNCIDVGLDSIDAARLVRDAVSGAEA